MGFGKCNEWVVSSVLGRPEATPAGYDGTPLPPSTVNREAVEKWRSKGSNQNGASSSAVKSIGTRQHYPPLVIGNETGVTNGGYLTVLP